MIVHLFGPASNAVHARFSDRDALLIVERDGSEPWRASSPANEVGHRRHGNVAIGATTVRLARQSGARLLADDPDRPGVADDRDRADGVPRRPDRPRQPSRACWARRRDSGSARGAPRRPRSRCHAGDPDRHRCPTDHPTAAASTDGPPLFGDPEIGASSPNFLAAGDEIGVFDFPDWSTGDDDQLVPVIEVDSITDANHH